MRSTYKNPPYLAGELPEDLPEVKLREVLAAKGMTQAGLAKKCGVAITTINRILRGQTCRHQTKRKIMRALKLDFAGYRAYFS